MFYLSHSEISKLGMSCSPCNTSTYFHYMQLCMRMDMDLDDVDTSKGDRIWKILFAKIHTQQQLCIATTNLRIDSDLSQL